MKNINILKIIENDAVSPEIIDLLCKQLQTDDISLNTLYLKTKTWSYVQSVEDFFILRDFLFSSINVLLNHWRKHLNSLSDEQVLAIEALEKTYLKKQTLKNVEYFYIFDLDLKPQPHKIKTMFYKSLLQDALGMRLSLQKYDSKNINLNADLLSIMNKIPEYAQSDKPLYILNYIEITDTNQYVDPIPVLPHLIKILKKNYGKNSYHYSPFIFRLSENLLKNSFNHFFKTKNEDILLKIFQFFYELEKAKYINFQNVSNTKQNNFILKQVKNEEVFNIYHKLSKTDGAEKEFKKIYLAAGYFKLFENIKQKSTVFQALIEKNKINYEIEKSTNLSKKTLKKSPVNKI